MESPIVEFRNPESRNYGIAEFGGAVLLELKEQLHRFGIFLTNLHIFI